MDVCPGHIFTSTNGFEMKIGLYIDKSEWWQCRNVRAQEPHSYPVYCQSYLPITIFS